MSADTPSVQGLILPEQTKYVLIGLGHKSKGTGERVYTHKNIEELRMNIELITN